MFFFRFQSILGAYIQIISRLYFLIANIFSERLQASGVARILRLGGLSPKPNWGFGWGRKPSDGAWAEPLEARFLSFYFKFLGGPNLFLVG